MIRRIPWPVYGTVVFVVFYFVPGDTHHHTVAVRLVSAGIVTGIVMALIYGFRQKRLNINDVGRRGPVSRPLSGATDDLAQIEIFRQRWIFVGFGARYLVMIDGIK